MHTPVFMSDEHVERMNELLAQDAEVMAECRALDRDYVIAYALADGPKGTVYWVFHLQRAAGASFSLDPPIDPAWPRSRPPSRTSERSRSR